MYLKEFPVHLIYVSLNFFINQIKPFICQMFLYFNKIEYMNKNYLNTDHMKYKFRYKRNILVFIVSINKILNSLLFIIL